MEDAARLWLPISFGHFYVKNDSYIGTNFVKLWQATLIMPLRIINYGVNLKYIYIYSLFLLNESLHWKQASLCNVITQGPSNYNISFSKVNVCGIFCGWNQGNLLARLSINSLTSLLKAMSNGVVFPVNLIYSLILHQIRPLLPLFFPGFFSMV